MKEQPLFKMNVEKQKLNIIGHQEAKADVRV